MEILQKYKDSNYFIETPLRDAFKRLKGTYKENSIIPMLRDGNTLETPYAFYKAKSGIKCDTCNKPINEGYVLMHGEHHFCSDNCIFDSKIDYVDEITNKDELDSLFESIESTCNEGFMYYDDWNNWKL